MSILNYTIYSAYTPEQVDASNRIWTACGFPSAVTPADGMIPLSATGEPPATHFGTADGQLNRDTRRFPSETILADFLVQGRVSQAELDAAGAVISEAALVAANARWDAADWVAAGFANGAEARAIMASVYHGVWLWRTSPEWVDWLAAGNLYEAVPEMGM